VLIAIGVIWWLIARNMNAKRGIDLNLLYKTIPPD
jgi:hypothetical protein